MNNYFDEKKAERALRFLSLLKHTGDFHGLPFDPLPWERNIVWDVFGTMTEQGIRQYRNVYIELSKKNGKSELLGGIATLHLFNKDEPNGEIYGCAGDRKQASIIFDTSVEMIMQDDYLKSMEKKRRLRIRESSKLIENVDLNTTYQVLSSEAFTKHGYRPSVVLFDELHVQPSADLWNTLTKGAFLARRQPLLWVITTAGDDPDRVSIGWDVHEKAKAILKARETGDLSNDSPSWYPVIYGYDGDDIYNEENWYKANPSLGYHLRIEDLRELARDAKLSPADERTFRWLHLTQWITTKLTTWQPVELFDKTVGEWSLNKPRREVIAEFIGKDCYMGMDLSQTTDLTGICLIFPPQGTQLDWRVMWDCWIPENEMKERIKNDKVPYDTWQKNGWINATEGSVVDYNRVEETIIAYNMLYNVKELPADKTFATMLLQRLEQNQKMVCVDVPQHYADLTDPMNMIEVLLKENKMTHDTNPVARWCFGNTSTHTNGNGQKKYVKESKGKTIIRTKRIDLTVAWVIGMARAKLYVSKIDLSAAILAEDWGM